ncbi:MAG: PAS domain S-box protein [Bacteroidetes bacterium]|nr:PAS domain S-box protein [Bacteroidota bacterium]
MDAVSRKMDRNINNLIEMSIDAFVMLDLNDNIIDLNSAAEDLFAMKSEKLKQANLFNFFREPNRAKEFARSL